MSENQNAKFVEKRKKVPPPSTIYKNSKNIERILFRWKLQKHKTNSVLMGEILNAKFDENHQNRPSGIRLSRVTPSLYYLQKLQLTTNSVLMSEN